MTEFISKNGGSGCCLPKSFAKESDTAELEITKSRRSVAANWCELPGGWFAMGADDGPYPQDGEGPQRQVFVDPYSISSTAVSNEKFLEFTAETGYQTVAEEQGWSFVFHMNVHPGSSKAQRVQHAPWWCRIDAACWSSPEGEDSTIAHRLGHPAIHITLRDAFAFCHWANCRLPTEAEWEYAARGGLGSQPFPWGEQLEPNGGDMSNVWKGNFPDQSDKLNGFMGTVPVTDFPPNGYGLYNMTGNVWEWTADRFTHLHPSRSVKNPTGPLNGDRYVAKGGSYLCHESYCARYRTSSRQALDPLAVADNVGFRIVRI